MKQVNSIKEKSTPKVKIKDFFPERNKFDYKDLLYYNTFNCHEYYVREIVSSTFWHVEACFDVFKDNKSFTVIFNRDVMSPYQTYNHIEIQKVVNNLDEQCGLIKEIVC